MDLAEAGFLPALRAGIDSRAEQVRQGRYYSRFVIASMYARLGKADLAFTMLRAHPMLDPIRSDLRFQDLLRRIGFPES